MNNFTLPGRNDVCPCGSGKKFKRCCLPLSSAADSSLAVAADATTPDLDTDEPSPDDPNFIPWMQKKIKELPLEERREFERILAAMLPGQPRQAGQGASAKRPAVPAPSRQEVAASRVDADEEETTVVDPAQWVVLEKALRQFMDVREPGKRKADQQQLELLTILERHPEAPLIPLDELMPVMMELAGKVQQAEKGVKQHWWQLKPKPLTQEGFNDLVQEAAERMAAAVSAPARLDQLREEWQDFAQLLASGGDEPTAALVQNGLSLVSAASTPAKGDFLVRIAFLSLRVAFRQIVGDEE